MAQPVLLRQLLPKPTSLAQPEPFLLKLTSTSTSTSTSVPGCNVPSKCMDSEATAAKSSEHHRRSSAQQRRREREARENTKPAASESSKLRRSAAQRARRQRELAAAIERDLQSTTPQYEYDPKVRSKAQKLRRRLEDAQRRLEINPDCDSTEALGRILDLDLEDNYSRFRRESSWHRMQRHYNIYPF
ncbi:hypothetical protein DFH06DRAFT_104358 [Mycena polygramma]|nr:hypothetical protein DFH06DRAFT_104358 [Mycena polygramma]